MATPYVREGLNRDALHMLPRERAAQVAHEALFPLQNLKPHEMVAGLGLLFATICHRVQIDPEEVHRLGLRILRDEPMHRQTNDSLQSLKDFAGLRIKGDRNVETC